MIKFTTSVVTLAFFGLLLTACESSSDGGNAETTSTEPTTASAEPTATEEVAPAVTSAVLNANLATEADLAGIGLAAETITQVLDQRPFLTMNELDALLGEEADKDVLYKKMFVPFNLNTTAEADFKMIPGVGDRMAHEFEEYRPYASMAQFRKEIGKYVDDKELKRLERFVYLAE